jgi:hypothetical protein
MKLFYSLLVFGLSIQVSCYLMWSFNIVPGISYPVNMEATTALFSLDNFWAQFSLAVAGAVGIGLAMLLLRVGTYAIYAMLIWAIGMFLPLISGFFLAIPNTLGAILGPFFQYSNPTTGVNPLLVVITLICAFAAWIFLMELVTQRNISQ